MITAGNFAKCSAMRSKAGASGKGTILVRRVLIVTSEWPAGDGDISGIHVWQQVSRLREWGLCVDVFHFRGRSNPARYIHAVLSLRRMELARYDLIHAHHGQSGIVALSQHDLPVVITFHGSDLQGIRNSRGRKTARGLLLIYISKLVARKSAEVIVVSEHMRRFLPKVSCHQIPVGIDLTQFAPIPKVEARSALRLPSDKKLILFIGNLSRPVKRFHLARKAVNRLNATVDAELIVADGIPHGQMPLYMNACDVLLISSSSEGSPSIVKEALAVNLAIVSTDVGDISQRIGKISGCVICANDQESTIANDLSRVLATGGDIDGRRQVIHLDERDLARKVITVYDKTLSSIR